MINYVTGDATSPNVVGNKIIAHVCNDIGGWGRGFVLSLTQRWPLAESSYRNWYQGNINADLPFKLGEVQLVKVHDDVYVANMIAQHGIFPKDGIPPIRYDALERCLNTVRLSARVLGASVHMPRVGAGLAGGKWSEIEQVIERALVADNAFLTYVYDFDTKDARTIPWSL